MSEEPSVADSLSSPTVARWELALRLRSRRRELGLTVSEVVEQLGIQRSRWSQIENDHTMIGVESIPQLATLFRFSPGDVEELRQLRAAAGDRRNAWWADHADLVNPELLHYYGLEHGASRIEAFSATLVFGLLQTDEYHRALMDDNPDVKRMDHDKLAWIRLQRQKLLSRPNRPLRLDMLMTEAVLWYECGSPGLLRRQLIHIADLIEELPDTLLIRIMPFAAPPGALAGAAIHALIEFDSPHLPSVVWQESLRVIGLSEDEELVDYVRIAHAQVRPHLLDREASLALIRERIDDLAGRA